MMCDYLDCMKPATKGFKPGKGWARCEEHVPKEPHHCWHRVERHLDAWACCGYVGKEVQRPCRAVLVEPGMERAEKTHGWIGGNEAMLNSLHQHCHCIRHGTRRRPPVGWVGASVLPKRGWGHSSSRGRWNPGSVLARVDGPTPSR